MQNPQPQKKKNAYEGAWSSWAIFPGQMNFQIWLIYNPNLY